MSEKTRSLIFRLPRRITEEVNRRVILKSLYGLIGEEIHFVDYVSQQNTNFLWRVTFKKDFDAGHLVGKKISVYGADVELEDLLEFNRFKYSTYRVMWLPHEFNSAQVIEFFKRGGECISVSTTEEVVSEKVSDLLEIKVKTGNFLVKVKQKKDAKELNVLGIQNLSKHKCLVNKFGSKPKCLRCDEVGHIRKNCPKNSLTCNKCKKKGHVAEKCNMALATATPVEELPDEDDTLEDAPTGFEEATVNTEELEKMTQLNITPAKIEKLCEKMDEEIKTIDRKRKKDINDSSLRSQEQTPKTNKKEEEYIPIEDISISSSY